MNRITIVFLLALIAISQITHGQATTGAGVVSSSVQFLSIAPDSRGGAMGDVGAATTPDVNSQHWNPAKYAFTESSTGIALSYTPWLANLVDDMNLAYLVGYHKIDKLQTISGSLRYFDLGSMQFYDSQGNPGNSSNPNEFAIDMGYALKLSDNWSGSVALRYILSDIYSGVNGATGSGSTSAMSAGNSFGADVAFYYTKTFRKSRKESTMSYGLNISNIGAKISYDDGASHDFIPTNLRIGGSYTTEIDKFNKISFSADLNKLLIPTPVYNERDGKLFYDPQGNEKVGPIEGIFTSFSDAPNGLSEELQEIMIGGGVEYMYSNQFAVRSGYFHEHKDKGDRKFLTFGAGIKMNVFSLDFSYIYTLTRQSPLENTIRFTLGFDIDDFRNQGKKGRRR